jgi:CBS domain-containing protein
MLAQGVSGIPVLDRDGRLRGLVSEGDLMRRAETGTDVARRSWWLRMFGSGENAARDYIKTHGATAGDVMSHPVVTVGPDEDIANVALLLEKKRIKRVPVAEDAKLLGIVSRADLLRGLATRGPLALERPAGDREIREALVAHLTTQPWATSALVNVTVNDGVVNMWGVFDSREQHEALLVAARNAPGARGVEDHMSLGTPY